MPKHNSRAQRTLSIFLTILLTSTALVGATPAASAQTSAPANDDFENAVVIDTTATTFTHSVSTLDATMQAGERDNCADGVMLANTVWYRWTAPADASGHVFNATTEFSDFDTVLVAYTGEALGSLTEIACDDDGLAWAGASFFNFAVAAGETYHFQLAGYYDPDFGYGESGQAEFALRRISDTDDDGYTTEQGDCNDSDATIYPGATDTPDDGIDQDCDGADATSVSSLPDMATTGFTGPTSAIAGDTVSYTATIQNNGANHPDGFSVYLYNTYGGVEHLITHGDVASLASATSTEVVLTFIASEGTYDLKVVPWPHEEANWADNNATQTLTVGPQTDADGDGFDSTAHSGTDCNDSDSSIHPGAYETTDGVDNDCDGLVDEIDPPAEFSATVFATIPTRSDDAVFGVNAGATANYDTGLDVAEPPAPPEAPWVRAFFAYPANPTVTELTASFEAPAGTIEWPLVVDSHYSTDGSTTAAHDVTLTWEPASFSALYPDFVVLLIDGTNEVDMTTQSSYLFSHAGGEILTKNNFAHREMTIRLEPTSPDLTIGTISGYTEGFGHGRFVEGRTTTFSVPVENVGLRGATDAYLDLYVENVLVDTADLPAIGSGHSYSATVSWTPTALAGTALVEFEVRHVAPAERSAFLDNNTAAFGVFVEDYAVSGLFTTAPLDFLPNEELSYTFEATNDGNAADTLSVMATSSTDSRFTTTVEPASLLLAPGETGTFWVNVTSPDHHEFNEIVTTIVATVKSGTDSLEQATTTTAATLLPTYELTVPAGWSLVSFPVEFRDETLTSTVLGNADVVWNWTGSGYVEPTTVAGGYGYWVYVSVETTFSVTGYKLDGILYEDHPTGWHLIGGTATDLANVVAETGQILNGLYSWTGIGYEFSSLNAAIGKGHWMFVESTTATVRVGTMGTV